MNNDFAMDKVSSDMINLMAKQLGATKIKSTPTFVNIYKFEIGEGCTLTYMIDIRRGKKGMYLRRVSPYPMLLGKFYGETDIVEYMKRDLHKFENAYKSSKFERFIELADSLTEFNRQIEQLFLNRKVPEAAFDEFYEEMQRVRGTIEQVARECPPLYDDERVIENGLVEEN